MPDGLLDHVSRGALRFRRDFLTLGSKKGATVRITAKGQVTIPQEIREKAGLLPATEVEFVLEEDGVRIVKARARRKPSRGEELVRRMRSGPKPKMTTDEILALTRGR